MEIILSFPIPTFLLQLFLCMVLETPFTKHHYIPLEMCIEYEYST
jgi:hypothetical protein